MAEKRSGFINLAAAIAVALATSLPIGWLVYHALFVGQAQSFDALIHARSLWGLSYGAPVNPVVGVHALAVHGYFTSLLLIPFARVLPSTTVLVGAQTAALFATIFLAARRAGALVAESRALEKYRLVAGPIGAVLGGLLVGLGSPLVLNPFLFDARPEIVGVPIALWALLRAEERGGLDRAAAIGLLLPMLAREEFAMVAIGAAVLAPRPKDGLRLRGIVIVVAALWWGFYVFALRRWIGGDFAVARLASMPAMLVGNFENASLVYKGELLFVSVLAMGGLVLPGWRWAGAAVPGLLFVVVQNRMSSLLLNFHYGMFAAPGLIVAGIAGLRRVTTTPSSSVDDGEEESNNKKQRKQVRLLGIATVAIVSSATLVFIVSSAAPGGRRFRRMFFTQTAETRDSRALIDRVPPDAGVAAPYAFAAPLADRLVVLHEGVLLSPSTNQDIPADIEYLALPASNWATIGRFAVEQRGFRLIDLKPGVMALLRRADANAASTTTTTGASPAPNVSALARAPVCTTPITRWVELGLSLCAVGRYTDARALLVVMRDTPPTRPGPVAIVSETGFGVLAFVGYDGVFNAEQLPIGKAMRLLTRAPLHSFPMKLHAGHIEDELGAMPVIDVTIPAADPSPR